MSASAGDNVVQVEDVTLGYGDVIVQERLSFKVRAREVFAILGASGSGKSTLLRTMTGLRRPRHGRILLHGNDIYVAEGEQRSRLLRQLGVTFQSGALFGSMSLLENVRLPLDELTDLDPGERNLVARAKLNQVGLGAGRREDAGRAFGRHAEARRDRARHGARSLRALPGRALGEPGSITRTFSTGREIIGSKAILSRDSRRRRARC